MGPNQSSGRRRWLLAAACAVVLCAAAPAGAGEDAGGRVGDIGQALVTLAIFAVLLFVLGKWAWKPVIAQLKRREEEIGEQIQDTERRQREAKVLEAEYRARIEHAEAEAKQIVARSVEEAASAREEMLATAREEGTKSIEAARTEIEHFKQAAIEDLQQAMAGLAVDVAAEIIREELGQETHDRLVEESLSRIPDPTRKAW